MIALYIKGRPYDTGLALLDGLVGICLFPMGWTCCVFKSRVALSLAIQSTIMPARLLHRWTEEVMWAVFRRIQAFPVAC